MPQPDVSLIGKVARQLSRPPSYAEESAKGSLLAASAASYGWRKEDEEVTQPTGFDPEAARLFEAVIEGAYLVANADGEFDQAEQSAFEHVVVTACGGKIAERQVSALLADLHDQLEEDGIEKRIQMVARSITREEHAREVLRIAALLAHVSGGVSEVEQRVLARLASEFGLADVDTERAISEAVRALQE